MKKFLPLLALCLLFCTLLTVGAAGASKGQITLSGEKNALKHGDTLELTVEINRNPGFKTLRCNVNFDRNVLEFVSAEGTQALNGFQYESSSDRLLLRWSGDKDQTGRVLASLTYEGTRNNDNEELDTYVFACGGTGFASNELLDSSSYSNRDVLYYTMRLMSRDTVPFDIDFKVMDSESLDSITDESATAWTIVLCSLIPAAALIMGTIVFIQRRHS